MNFSFSALIAGLVFGVLGIYFFKRGKNDAELPLIAIGLVLMLYPYLVENIYLLWGIGILLVGIGFKLS
jgi:glucose uptake protein GlcU